MNYGFPLNNVNRKVKKNMILEYTIHEALVELPGIRNVIPKELLRELTKDENYIMRLDVDEDGNIHYLEIGYRSDKWTLAR